MRKRTRYALLTGIALGAVLATAGAVELVGRWFFTPLLLRYSSNQALRLQLANPKDLGVVSLYVPHHYYLYATRPSYRSADGLVRHNSLGCRAEEVTRDRPTGVYRIIAVGGSTTYGTLVRANEGVHSYRLEKLLNEWAQRRRMGLTFEVVNCGVPGATSAETLVRYIFALSEYRPDLLLIQQGLNDALPRSLPSMSRDYREFAKTWDDSRVVVQDMGFIRRLLRTVRNRFSDSIWSQGVNFVVRHPFWDPQLGGSADHHATNTVRVFAANTRYLVALAAGDGARVLLASEHIVWEKGRDWRTASPGRFRATLEHNEVLREIARSTGALYLDLQGRLCACPEIMPDGRHLNAEGERLKALAIFDYLTREVPAHRWLPTRRRPA